MRASSRKRRAVGEFGAYCGRRTLTATSRPRSSPGRGRRSPCRRDRSRRQTRTPPARRWRRNHASPPVSGARVRVSWSASGVWVRVGSDIENARMGRFEQDTRSKTASANEGGGFGVVSSVHRVRIIHVKNRCRVGWPSATIKTRSRVMPAVLDDISAEILDLKKQDRRHHPGPLLPGGRDPGARRRHRRQPQAGPRGDQGRFARHRLLRRPLHGRDGQDAQPLEEGAAARSAGRLQPRRRLPRRQARRVPGAAPHQRPEVPDRHATSTAPRR